MNYQTLKTEIETDPLGRGYATMDNQQVVDSLNTTDRTVVGETRATALTLMRRFGAAAAAGFLDKLKTASEDAGYAMAPVLRHVIPFLYTGEGVDLGDTQTRALLTQLYTDGRITAAEANGLKNLASKTVSRAAELGLPEIKLYHIESARN